MKVFKAITERNGATSKEPGKVSTEFLYAAETIEEVSTDIMCMNERTGHVLVSISEVAPEIFILHE